MKVLLLIIYMHSQAMCPKLRLENTVYITTLVAHILVDHSSHGFVSRQDDDYTDTCFRSRICMFSVQIHQDVLQHLVSKNVASAYLPYPPFSA